MRTPRRLLAATAALLVLAGCGGGGGGRAQPSPTPDGSLDRLGAAITQVNRSRAALAAASRLVTAGAAVLDTSDALAATGDRSGVRAAGRAVDRAAERAGQALRRLPGAVSAYEAALRALFDATNTAGLEAPQRDALQGVVDSGRREVAADRTFVEVAGRAWRSYQALRRGLETWLRRANAGWYRDRREAAASYGILLADTRPGLDRSRQSLAVADGERTASAGRTAAAVRAARTALADLAATPSG